MTRFLYNAGNDFAFPHNRYSRPFFYYREKTLFPFDYFGSYDLFLWKNRYNPKMLT